jgi:hypothetical protein
MKGQKTPSQKTSPEEHDDAQTEFAHAADAHKVL